MGRQEVSYSLYRNLLWLWDWITLNGCLFALAYGFDRVNIDADSQYLNFFYFINLAWLASVSITTLYLNKNWLSFEVFLKNTLKSYFLAALAVLVFIFALKYDFSRLFIASCLGMFGLMLFVNRLLFHVLVVKAKSKFKKRIVILGDNEISQKLVSYFKDQSQFISVVGYFTDRGQDLVMDNIPAFQEHVQEGGSDQKSNFYRSGQILNIKRDYRVEEDSSILVDEHLRKPLNVRFFWKKNKHPVETPILGCYEDCLEFVKQNEVAEIYSTISPEQNPALYDLALLAEENLVRFKFVLDMNLFLKRRFHVDFIENLPVLSFRTEPLEDVGNRIRKRLLDIGVSLFAIVFILSWLTPLLAILIKLESKGPVFFLQLRSGRRNKPFWCLKFRSLRVNDESDSKQVTKGDERITRLGRFIRKTNIDELPQFVNVLAGQMSVVGPRPHMLKHTKEFHAMDKEYMIRHFVKPGITGLAQVKGFRGEIKNPELLKGRIEQDIYYMENWSIWFDIKLMLATIVVTFKGDKNAY